MKNRKWIPGSEKSVPRKARVVGKVDPDMPIQITVLLRRRNRVAGDGRCIGCRCGPVDSVDNDTLYVWMMV